MKKAFTNNKSVTLDRVMDSMFAPAMQFSTGGRARDRRLQIPHSGEEFPTYASPCRVLVKDGKPTCAEGAGLLRRMGR